MPELKPRQTSMVIYQGDDIERFAELRQKVEFAEREYERDKKAPARTGDDVSDDAVVAAKAAFDAFVDEAAERAVEVRIRALGRTAFRNLMKDHPPRVDDKGEELLDDGAYGVNLDTFADALLAYSHDGVSTILEPAFPSSADRQRFLDDISDGDYDDLFTRAYHLNRNPGADPKASRYSVARPTSTETLSSPDRLG